MEIKIGKKTKQITICENCEIDFNGIKTFNLTQTIQNDSKATYKVELLNYESKELSDALESHFNKHGIKQV